MNEISAFTSRPARISCSAREFFDFVTDVRNFSRFISPEVFPGLTAGKDSLSFQANMLGTIRLYISEKVPFSRVSYRGENSQVKDFILKTDISEKEPGKADVIITLEAGLNPVLKMLAAAPVKGFLDTLVHQMESFSGWTPSGAQNQPR